MPVAGPLLPPIDLRAQRLGADDGTVNCRNLVPDRKDQRLLLAQVVNRDLHTRIIDDFKTLHLAFVADGQAHLVVADSGPGVPVELREQVFETFFTTKGREGSGLGLSVVRNVMRRHNGSVTIEERDGFGAVFVLRFALLACLLVLAALQGAAVLLCIAIGILIARFVSLRRARIDTP